jgi:ABC-2 type transport system permease protein
MNGPGRPAAAIGAIALNELRRVARDRTALFFALALPVVIIVIIGTTFGAEDDLDVGVFDDDGSARAAELVDGLAAAERVSVERYGSLDALQRDIRTGGVAAGLVVPEGYGDDVDAGRVATVELVADPTSTSAAAVQETVRAAVADEAGRAAAARFTASQGAGSYEDAAALVDRVAGDVRPVAVQTVTVGGTAERELGSFDYTAPANLTLFVFVNTLAVGTVLALDRRRGMTRRMLATPHGTGTILAGIGAAKLLFALVQSALIIAIGAVLFGVGWGDPLGGALVVVLFAVVATSVGLLVGSSVSDPDQAQAIAIPIAIGLGMLGGCMWPLDIVPDTMRVVGHLAPHAWAMDAWIALVFDGAGVRAIIVELAVLAGFAVVLGVMATRRLRVALTT